MKLLRWIPLFFLLASCAHAPEIVSPEGERSAPVYQETGGAIAVENLKQTGEASYHRIRLERSENPHTHNAHDLVVFLLKGKVVMHYGEKSFGMKEGDVMEIPRGTVHWAEQVDGAAEVYAVFTPPYDGKDYHPV